MHEKTMKEGKRKRPKYTKKSIFLSSRQPISSKEIATFSSLMFHTNLSANVKDNIYAGSS